MGETVQRIAGFVLGRHAGELGRVAAGDHDLAPSRTNRARRRFPDTGPPPRDDRDPISKLAHRCTLGLWR